MRTATTTDPLARLRLLQLTSPALPVGGFTYSQGLEWAVDAGWVQDPTSLCDWLHGLMHDGLQQLDIPILKRQYMACQQGSLADLTHWSRYLLASRETSELRMEEGNRGRALTELLINLDIPLAEGWKATLALSQSGPFALAASHWRIDVADATLGYAWSWLENQVAAAIKLIPLGQTDGQRVQLNLAEALPLLVDKGLLLADEDIGASAPALAIASSRHESQYTRLFRS